jgi:hypothetical protein
VEPLIIEDRVDDWDDCVTIPAKNGRPAAGGVADRNALAIDIRRWPDFATISRRRDRW